MPKTKDSKKLYIPFFVTMFVILFLTFIKFSPLLNVKVKGAESDPVLVDLMMDKEIINTEAAADSITVYVRLRAVASYQITNSIVHIVSDDGCEGSDCIDNPSHQYSHPSLMAEGCTASDLPDGFDLEGITDCGDATDGIYSTTFDFPQYSLIGDWKIYLVEFWDDQSTEIETINVYPSESTLTITTEAGERNVAFNNAATTEDVLAPVIESHAFDKESIDTTDNAENLTMYIRASDNLSGISDEFPPAIHFSPENDPGFQGSTEAVSFEFTKMSTGCDALPAGLNVGGLQGCGDSMDGIYEATAEIPRYSTGGTWNVYGVWNLSDLLNNQIDPQGLVASFNNTSTVYDTQLPILKSITITPEIFNTAEAAQTVTIEMNIEDDLSGVDYLGDFGIEVGIWSIYSGFESYYNGPTQLVSGTITDGIFRTEVEMPQGIAPGFWRVAHIDIMDLLGRERRYTTADLSLAFPTLPLYLINQGTTERVELLAGWTLEDWPYYDGETIVWPDISVRFPEGTVITKQQGGIFAFHRMLATKYDLSGSTGVSSLLDGVNSDYEADLLECDAVEGCVSTSVNSNNLIGTPLHVIKMGIPGLNLTFSKPVTIIVGMDEEYLGSTFVVQTFDEDQGIWVEHGTCKVAMVEPEEAGEGGDNFGIVKLVAYPGCSFTTDHASFFSTNVLGLETEAGVPRTGLGGIENSSLTKYFGWIK